MKKTILAISAALLLTAPVCAAAPELRNVMPDGWSRQGTRRLKTTAAAASRL